MPKRPRQHQLEDESRVALRARLPSQWVFRDVVPDYGIDGEVEIFDDNGQSTGQKFLVQLKANDGLGVRAQTCTISHDARRYYASLGDPVLIVLFSARSNELYAKWSFTLDPYYGRKGRKTLTFHFNAAERWTDETSRCLRNDVAAFHCMKSPALPVPVKLSVVVKQHEVYGLAAAQIEWGLREAAGLVPGLIRVKPAAAATYETIIVEEDKVSVILGGVPCFTLHLAKEPLDRKSVV